ncbi:MAG: hypothetical protein QCI82_00445 [Candidatus Thermoplasmatota archaeon]|nr:hypothetical protein [Candidatus Thermoplasmatota archaeon]
MSSGGSIGLAIVLMGAVVGLAVSQPHIDSAVGDLRQAREDLKESAISIRNTDFSIDGANYNNTTRDLEIELFNSGSDPIEGGGFQFLLDGVLAAPSYEGGPLIYPGYTAIYSFDNVSKPLSARVVGPFGIARHLNAGDIEET